MNCLLLALLPLLGSASEQEAPPSALSTLAEKSGWTKTGRYEEVVRLCAEFEKSYPGKARCARFAETPEGRPMLALAASSDGTLDPESARRAKRPVIFLQGGIHAGEIDGKDAGFLALRELLDGRPSRDLLSKVTVVFIPVFNADGHERFGPNNRPNQRGPEEMGWRTTAQNLNLNRDYAKADAPEMAAMLELLGRWDPIVYADMHVTDGAQFQHDISVTVHPADAGPERLAAIGRSMRERIVDKLDSEGHLALSVYPSFVKEDDPSSGIQAGAAPPRLAHSYWGVRNRFGILVETHSWKDYAARVKATHDFILAVVSLAAEDGPSWARAAAAQDEDDRNLKEKSVPLTFEATGKKRIIDFLGYACTRTPSTISGQLMTSYDTSRPEVWKIPFFDELKPGLVVRPPQAGYIVPPAHAGWMAQKLRLHGIAFEVLKQGRSAALVETFRASTASFDKEPYEGRTRLSVQGEWAAETRPIQAGSLFVSIRQPLARLVLHLFEPKAPDSFLSWGFFNAAFERKEYMEPYVAEQVGLDMLAKSPAIKAEFQGKLAADPAFAKSPDKRLDFFYRRHPSWDERFELYPVYRTDQNP